MDPTGSSFHAVLSSRTHRRAGPVCLCVCVSVCLCVFLSISLALSLMDGESSSAADRAIDPTPALSQPFLTASLRDLIPVPPPNSNLPQKRSLHFDTVDDSFPSLAPPSSRVSFARKALKRWFQKAHGAEDDVHVQDGYVFIDANSEIPLPSNFVSVLKPHQVGT